MWEGGTKTNRQRVYMCKSCFLKEFKMKVSEAKVKDLPELKEWMDFI